METSVHKLPSVITLFKQAWTMYRSNFLRYVGLAFIPIIAALTIAIALSIGFLGISFAGVFDFGAMSGIVLAFLAVAVLVLVVAVSIYVQLWASMAMVVQARDGGRYTIKEAMHAGREYIKRYFSVSVFSGASVLGAGSVLLIPTLLLLGLLARVINFDPIMPEVGYVAGLVIAWVIIGLLIVPAIVVGVWLSMSTFIIVSGSPKDDALAVLLKSQQLVTGRWWAVFGRTLAPVVIFALIAMVTGETNQTEMTPRSLFGQLLNLILSPLVMLYLYSLYLHLVKLPVPAIDEIKTRKMYTALTWVGGVMFIALTVTFFLIIREL